MRAFAWALLAVWSGDVLPPLLLAGDSGSRAQYVGGTVAGLPSKSEGNINTTDEGFLLFRTKHDLVRIPYDKINTIEYGQRVSRRFVGELRGASLEHAHSLPGQSIAETRLGRAEMGALPGRDRAAVCWMTLASATRRL